jgi:hypothetical protein
MGLGLTGGGGESLISRIPYIKWNAKAGRMFRTDRTNENGNWESVDVDITDTAIFQVDFDTVKTGWISFSNPIDFSHATPHGVSFGTKPGENTRENPYKLGFIVRVFSEKNLDGLREFSSNAGVSNKAFEALFSKYETDAGTNKGKSPVVKLSGSVAMKNDHGTNFSPVFEIVSWAPRNAAFDLAGEDVLADPAPAVAAGDDIEF